MKRGHIRVGKNFGADIQEKALREHGVTIFYKDDIENAVLSLRRGELLYVVGLRGLASSKGEIVKAAGALHDRGAAAFDVLTGKRSDGRDGIALMAAAAVDLTNERMGGHRNAKKFGRKGGKAASKNRADRKTPLATAEKHWFDRSMSNDQAIEKINSYGYPDDWTYGALYAHFKKRGVVTGRPAKKT